MTTQFQRNIHKPKRPIDGTIKYLIPRALTASITSIDTEPTCYTSVVKHDVWRTAMSDEFNALIKNGTWTMVLPFLTMNVVGCKWVSRIKRKADGSLTDIRHA